MKLPKFKPSGVFLDDHALPCLVAKVRNSDFQGVATRHIAKYKRNPKCEIYLRGKDNAKISPWQLKQLQELLSGKGLADAIENGMREYGRTKDAYVDTTEKERSEITKRGIPPFMTVETIIMDEVKREVILSLSTRWDGNLGEHGVTIYRKHGRWRFDYADYFIRYQSGLERKKTRKELIAERDELLSEAAKELKSVTGFLDTQRSQWDKAFPLPQRAVKVQTDPGFLYGDWKFDTQETRKALKQMGKDKSEIAAVIEGTIQQVYRFAPNLMRLMTEDGAVDEFFCGCEKRGKRVKVLYKIEGGESVLTADYWHDGDILIHESGQAFRRI